MRISRPTSAVLAAAAFVAALASCAEPTAAPALAPSLSTATFAAQDGALLACPVREARSFTVTIDQRGARYAKHGIEVVVPAGALAGPQQFRVTLPRSPYVEADIDAIGYEHFTFLRPVRVTFDYARCGNVVLSAPALSVWYIADDTRDLLEPMPATDDRTTRRITFETNHLSGYGLAYRTAAPDPVEPPADVQ
jgi:hypothetical protein